jgi:DHA2 family multidrug resistance protein-like MFS transporter
MATGPATGYGYTAIWISVTGVGLGFTMPVAMNAALGALSAETSGVGSGLIQAMRQVGGAIGVAILGTVLNSGYRDQVDVAGLPGAAAGAVRDSAAGGVVLADKLGDPGLLHSVQAAFTHGMDLSLLVSAVIALAGAVLTLVFLPARPPRPAQVEPQAPVSLPAAAESMV